MQQPGAPFGAAPCQLPLPTGQVRQAGPQMATTFPLAQSYSPAQADGSALSEFGESYFPEFGRSPRAHVPAIPATSRLRLRRAGPGCASNDRKRARDTNQLSTKHGHTGHAGHSGMPMPEQTPPGYRSGAVSQAGLKQVEGC